MVLSLTRLLQEERSCEGLWREERARAAKSLLTSSHHSNPTQPMDEALRKVIESPEQAPRIPANGGARQVVMQLQMQHQDAARQLNTVRQQMAGREREKKLNTLTLREIEDLPRGAEGVTCYKGVGRMCVAFALLSRMGELRRADDVAGSCRSRGTMWRIPSR